MIMETVPCSNCYSTGTIFRKLPRSVKAGAASEVCPVCKGKCKVPAPVNPDADKHGRQ
jgi:DnaJ-class molecular chaperone